MRYSRGVLNESYHPGSVVLMTECCKLLVCSSIVFFGIGDSKVFIKDHNNNNNINGKNRNIITAIIYLIRNSGYTWVPTTCYFIQNSLQYVASENLSSSVFAVLQQMKILSAAIASVLMLKKSLSWTKWRALLLLCCGGLLMEYHTFEMNDIGHLQNSNDPVKGTAAILTIVGLSGFAGVMTQILLKNKSMTKSTSNEKSLQLSIWDRNIQFAFWSVLFGLCSLFMDRSWMYDGNGLFHDWSLLTIALVFIWTLGGLLVALTIKYTNVIIKGFASAISLILICINGWLLLSDYLDIIFIVGALVTIIATFNYNDTSQVIQTQNITKSVSPRPLSPRSTSPNNNDNSIMNVSMSSMDNNNDRASIVNIEQIPLIKRPKKTED